MTATAPRSGEGEAVPTVVPTEKSLARASRSGEWRTFPKVMTFIEITTDPPPPESDILKVVELARYAVEGLHGTAAVLLWAEISFEPMVMDSAPTHVMADESNQVGSDFLKVFVALAMREWGEGEVHVFREPTT